MRADLQGTEQRTRARVGSRSQLSEIPTYMRIGGVLLRTLFLIALAVMTLRVSIPQDVWAPHVTSGDLIRLALGMVLCVAIAIQLFKLPKDHESRRIWFFFGLAAVPITVIFAVGIW